MALLFIIILIIGLAIVPTMVGARVVGARNIGFGSALLSVILLAGLSTFVGKNIENQFIALIVSASAGGFLLAAVLGTTFWRAIGVSIIATVIQFVVIFFFAGVLIGSTVVAA